MICFDLSNHEKNGARGKEAQDGQSANGTPQSKAPDKASCDHSKGEKRQQ
jgi:hypothetical protein